MIAVWKLMNDGRPAVFYERRTLADALTDARRMLERVPSAGGALDPRPPLFAGSRVWIAPAPRIALKPARARFRRSGR